MEEPQEELGFDDDNAYTGDGNASAYGQYDGDDGGYAPQPSVPQPSSFAAHAAALNQPSMQSQAAAVQNTTVQSMPTDAAYQPMQMQQPMQTVQTMQAPSVSSAEPPSSNGAAVTTSTGNAPAKRKKYDRGTGSKLKSGGMVSENSARIWRRVIIGLLAVLVMLSGKNALIPPKSMSEAQIQQIAMQATGNTGFPMAEGAAIAQAFAQAYVPISGDSGASAVLSNFYTGQRFDPSGSNAVSGITPVSSGGSITQQIKSGPFVFSETPVDSKTANYVVGMLIYQTLDGDALLAEGSQNVNYKWLYLNIGVVYDPDAKTFAIDRNSPTIVAEPDMKASSDLESAKEPGDGAEDDEVTKDANDTVVNFMKAWGKSDTSALNTLVSKDHTVNAMNGLDGIYTLGDNANIQFKAYGKPAGDSYYRGLVTVQWVDRITSDQINATKQAAGKSAEANAQQEDTVTYSSTYLLKIAKTDDGKYLIQDIHPYYYFPNDTN